jgi:hypothetical protein
MTMDRSDLDDLLGIVDDFAEKTIKGSTDVDLDLARSTPLLSLASDLTEAGVPHPLAWAFEVVEAVSSRSASWGYVLASRYAAQFVFGNSSSATADAFVAVGERDDGEIVVPAAPLAAGPTDSLVALCGEGEAVLLKHAVIAAEQPDRTGLAGARLTRLTGGAADAVAVANVNRPAPWPVLLGAVVCGLGNALLHESILYTQQREQFGAPIASFPGLRAIVGRAHSAVLRARACLYSHAFTASPGSETDALATAADTVMSCAIDAVQTMGGYGYIEEFPVAGMFRDAVSLRARSTSALLGWRASAEDAYEHKGRVK